MATIVVPIHEDNKNEKLISKFPHNKKNITIRKLGNKHLSTNNTYSKLLDSSWKQS